MARRIISISSGVLTMRSAEKRPAAETGVHPERARRMRSTSGSSRCEARPNPTDCQRHRMADVGRHHSRRHLPKKMVIAAQILTKATQHIAADRSQYQNLDG